MLFMDYANYKLFKKQLNKLQIPINYLILRELFISWRS